jgi:hypothetical protein
MYILAQLVVKSYIPHILKKGMWFVRTLYYGDKQIFELDQTFLNLEEEEKFLTENGYPVKPYVVEEYMDKSTPAILATPEEIGWFDEGDHTDELRDITLQDINDAINYNEGFIEIDVDDETGEPITINDKVIIKHAVEDEFEEYIMCNNCGSTDLEYNSSDQIICNNCGWEEDNNDM